MKYSTLALLLLCSTATYAQTKTPAKTAPKTAVKTAVKTPTKIAAKPIGKALVTTTLETQADSISYAFGMDIGNSLKAVGMSNLSESALTKGITDAIKELPSQITNSQKEQLIQDAITEFRNQKLAASKEKESAYFTENAKNPGIVTLPEGVQYQVLKAGQGAKPTADDVVKVHYAGSLIDGTEFDNSYKRGEPLELGLNRVIEGWKIAVPHMNVGSKYKLFIPSGLAYGDRATGQIPANSILIFEIELLEITTKNEIQ